MKKGNVQIYKCHALNLMRELVPRQFYPCKLPVVPPAYAQGYIKLTLIVLG